MIKILLVEDDKSIVSSLMTLRYVLRLKNRQTFRSFDGSRYADVITVVQYKELPEIIKGLSDENISADVSYYMARYLTATMENDEINPDMAGYFSGENIAEIYVAGLDNEHFTELCDENNFDVSAYQMASNRGILINSTNGIKALVLALPVSLIIHYILYYLICTGMTPFVFYLKGGVYVIAITAVCLIVILAMLFSVKSIEKLEIVKQLKTGSGI